VKLAENDNSFNYIGGYYHESAFSMILLCILFLSTLINWKSKLIEPLVIVIVLIGIFLANYRTNIIATLPIIMIVAVRYFNMTTNVRWRPTIIVGVVTVILAVFVEIGQFVPDRYDDILKAFERGLLFLDHPDSFDRAEKAIFSYRFYLWSLYIDGWLNGDVFQFIIGLGPASYDGRFLTHAHNMYFSILYELGVVGLIWLFGMLGYYLVLAASIADGSRRMSIIACMAGFLLSTLATLAMWQLEGLIAYAVILAYVWRHAPPRRSGKVVGAGLPAFSPAAP
jgi:O-antigen ligase